MENDRPVVALKVRHFFRLSYAYKVQAFKVRYLMNFFSKNPLKERYNFTKNSLMPETPAKVSGGKNMPASPLVSYVSPPQPYCTPFRIRAEAVVTRRSFFDSVRFFRVSFKTTHQYKRKLIWWIQFTIDINLILTLKNLNPNYSSNNSLTLGSLNLEH